MRTNILKLSLVLLLSFSMSYSFAQVSEANKTEYKKEKFLLTQRLMTCQSMAYTVINERDYKTKNIYVNLGSKNYNYAYQSFLEMQKLDTNMDEKLKERISTMLELYSTSFASMNALDKPEMALALSFGKRSLQIIMEKLFAKIEEEKKSETKD